MGEISDMMLNGILDERTGEYLGKSVGYPRTLVKGHYNTMKFKYKRSPAEKKIASIRKEIAILVNEQGMGIQEARKAMNIKYGKGWRERGFTNNPDDQWSEEDLKEFI